MSLEAPHCATKKEEEVETDDEFPNDILDARSGHRPVKKEENQFDACVADEQTNAPIKKEEQDTDD